MHAYLRLLCDLLDKGDRRSDRTETGCLSLFGYQLRFDLSVGFPLLTTKKLHLRSIIYELLWFLRGEEHIGYLKEHNVNIWDPWARDGHLGPIYGVQWRSWPTSNGESIDQIGRVIKEIQARPYSRRLIVSAWNVAQLEEMALPPCHLLFQFYVHKGHLSAQLYQRSADAFLGLPFNIASYSLLTMMIAQVCELKPGVFIHTLGDVHLYLNHQKQAEKQIERKPYPLAQMHLNPEQKDIDSFVFEDFRLSNYQAHPHIKASVSV